MSKEKYWMLIYLIPLQIFVLRIRYKSYRCRKCNVWSWESTFIYCEKSVIFIDNRFKRSSVGRWCGCSPSPRDIDGAAYRIHQQRRHDRPGDRVDLGGRVHQHDPCGDLSLHLPPLLHQDRGWHRGRWKGPIWVINLTFTLCVLVSIVVI